MQHHVWDLSTTPKGTVFQVITVPCIDTGGPRSEVAMLAHPLMRPCRLIRCPHLVRAGCNYCLCVCCSSWLLLIFSFLDIISFHLLLSISKQDRFFIQMVILLISLNQIKILFLVWFFFSTICLSFCRAWMQLKAVLLWPRVPVELTCPSELANTTWKQ